MDNTTQIRTTVENTLQVVRDALDSAVMPDHVKESILAATGLTLHKLARDQAVKETKVYVNADANIDLEVLQNAINSNSRIILVSDISEITVNEAE